MNLSPELQQSILKGKEEYLRQLPIEILQEITKYLSLNDIYRLCQTSTYYQRNVCEDPHVWIDAYRRELGYDFDTTHIPDEIDISDARAYIIEGLLRDGVPPLDVYRFYRQNSNLEFISLVDPEYHLTFQGLSVPTITKIFSHLILFSPYDITRYILENPNLDPNVVEGALRYLEEILYGPFDPDNITYILEAIIASIKYYGSHSYQDAILSRLEKGLLDVVRREGLLKILLLLDF